MDLTTTIEAAGSEAANKMEADSEKNSIAPIADCDDFKLDGGEATTKVVSPPSCTRLDEASQACV